MEAREVLKKYQSFAVVGVTNNEEKYGYKIYQCLKKLGKTVYGISPIYPMVNEDKTYPNLTAVNHPIDVAVMVVNPKFGQAYIDECQQLNIKHIWLQPGTYNVELMALIQHYNLDYYQNCVLVESENL